MILARILSSSAFAVAITLLLYWLSLHLQRRYAWANPLLMASIALIFVLSALRIPYSHYQAGGRMFFWLLGPATVALAIPMYKQGVKLKGWIKQLLVIELAGSIVGMVTAGVAAWAMGANRQVIMSVLPKSVTTPIAVQVSSDLHGNPTLTAAMVLISGLLGSIVGKPVLRLARIGHDHAVGSAIGSSSHAIGTAALIRESEVQGAVSSLAMAMAGVITSILAMFVAWCWR